jgi:Domain of Unknown Function (DUF748)
LTTAIDSVRSFASRRRRWLWAALAAVVLYTLVGFIVFPWVLHRELEKRLSVALHREVTIQKVRANPFSLSLTISGFLVKDRDGSPFISWERLFVNGRLVPIIKRELDLDSLELIRLHGRVHLFRDGTLNFSDLLESSDTPQPAPGTPEAKPPFVFGVDHLALVQAELDFTDVSHPHPFHSTVGPFTIRLDNFRTRPDAKSPYAFSGTTEAGEAFSWSGDVHIEPIRSEGTLTLEGLRLPKYAPYYDQDVDFDLLDGTARVQSSYQLEWGPARRLVQLTDGSLSVRQLVLRLRGASEPSVELPQLDVGGVKVDVLENVVAVDSVSLRGATVHVHRGKDGRVDLMRLASGGGAAAPPATATAKRPAKPAKPYKWTVRKVELVEERLLFDDQLPDRPVKLALAPVDVTLGNLSSEHGSVSTLALSAGWNGKGQLKADGTFSLWRPSADLTLHVRALDLPSIDPYLSLYGNLDARLGDGRLTIEGHVHLDLEPDPMVYNFEGDVSVDGLSLLDSKRGQELIRWKSLQILGLKVTSQPEAFVARSVRWIDPRVKVQIAEDGSSNLRRMLRAPAAPAKGAPPATATAAKQPPGNTQAQPSVSIATFQIVRGEGGLVDRSVHPVALFGVSDLEVRIRGLSNDLAARAQVDIQGTVGGGPLKLSGTLSPRFKNDATDIKISSKGIDLTPLAPYFGKYVGYALDKGKLDLDLGYKVAARHLEAQNLVRIDQLTLGEETHSPEATKLPVKLGLAVLQDRDGLIELDVPVEGNVDDPDFRLGKLIWHAVGNIFTKIVTAPFAALGALFGGGSQRLDIIDFSVGTSDVDAKGEKTLQGLSKALYSRPALKLEIQGTVDAVADGAVLRHQALRRRAREEKWKAQGRRGGATSPDTVELLEDEYVKFVSAEYARTFSKDPKPATPPTVTEMEDRLSAAVDLGPEALPALARKRGEVAREALLKSGQVETSRLFIVEGGERATKEQGPHVYFTLK